ncbi:phage major capsid protein, HK97 family [Pilibacter termitis]|uniref:Phage major capsid protein, HK97 family n=1 Tax=Pilibacter termitis TaxID=263852 RepID=A0A1T4PDM5_9ENTE|nr:phage major capsid protein [Pilibacter termitis]SJZ89673.1 phage major capsid protein, HK97 family [Pilibacter termitis]
MAIKLNSERYTNAKEKYFNVVRNGGDEVAQQVAYNEMLDAQMEELSALTESKFNQLSEERMTNKTLSANEIKFFNAFSKDVGTKNEILLPQETINEVFDDMQQAHPILSVVNFKQGTLRIKALISETSGVAIWGKINGDIQGQLDATFNEVDFSQNKLTAFVVIPNDALEYGATWLKQFITTQITEAFAVALESAIVSGNGLDKPIGLNRDVHNGVAVSGTTGYPEKTASDDLLGLTAENAPEKFAKVLDYLSVKENGEPVTQFGTVYLLINPQDYNQTVAKFISKNANGVYGFDLPYSMQFITSAAQPVGKLTAFLASRYDAYVAGGQTIKEFDQTLAFEDMRLYACKTFAYGKAKDDKVAGVYNLTPVTTPPTSPTL